MNKTVRPYQSADDYYGMIDYFRGGSPEFLHTMGLESTKLPQREQWFASVWQDHFVAETDPARQRFYVAWAVGDVVVGHSSINKIKWGIEAFGHLHLWRNDLRQKGLGLELFRLSVDLYFERFQLQRLFVEPRAENPAPNRALVKLGFEFVERYRTVPNAFAFEQDLNRYVVTRESWVKR